MLPTKESVTILGCRIDNVTWEDIDHFCLEAFEGTAPQQIVTINGEFILEAEKNEEFRKTINAADLVVPDSTNVVWVSRLKGQPLRQTTPGSDLTLRLCRLAAKSGKSVYLLGGWNGVARQTAEFLNKQFPTLRIAGWSEKNPEEITSKEIRAVSADIVFVAYGAPQQELWIAEHKEGSGAKVLVGIGGTFDMLSGRLPRAPQWLRSLHFEWFWRLLLQPSRFRRIWNAVVIFPLKALIN